MSKHELEQDWQCVPLEFSVFSGRWTSRLKVVERMLPVQVFAKFLWRMARELGQMQVRSSAQR